MFVNDCIIFAKTSRNAYNHINIILHKFYALFGQLVNLHKSAIQISNNMQWITKRRLKETPSIIFPMALVNILVAR